MAIDDYFESEVGLAVAATAALLSPKARSVLRRGLVFGVAGALSAGEALASAGRRVGSAAHNVATSGQTDSTPDGAAGASRRSARSSETTA